MSTAIVLSGGGAKGDFEVGAVRFLYDHGIRPDILCGTSVGSINAVKLAEGEPDASGPADGLNAPGLPGLVAIWKSLHTNEDMYVAEDWLNDIDKEIRDALTANYSDPDLPYPGPLVVTGETQVTDAGVLRPVAWFFNDLLKNAAKCLDLCKTLSAVQNRNPQSLYSLGPIADKLGRYLNADRVRQWGTKGKKLRMAVVSLESGQLRYVTEDGSLRERYGNAVIAEHLSVKDGALASSAIPATFRAVQLGNETYVDGGVRNIVPIEAALHEGATEIYAIVASQEQVAPWTYAGKNVLQIGARAVEDILLNEITWSELHPTPGWGTTSVHIIQPSFDMHDALTIHPGYIGIAMDYGYMRAADVVLKFALPPSSPGYHPPAEYANDPAAAIIKLRLEIFQLERVANLKKVGPSQADALAALRQLRQKKRDLYALVDERRRAGGVLPPGSEAWSLNWEWHRWTPLIASPWDRLAFGSDAVEAESPYASGAAFVAQEAPGAMVPGQSYAVSVTFRNTGRDTWTSASLYALGSQSPQDNMVWLQQWNRVPLPSDVPSGSAATFRFTVKAPVNPGMYAFQWRMVHDGVEWFGDFSPSIAIRVEPTECEQMRAHIAVNRDTTKQLTNELAGLDIKFPGDKIRIKEITTQLASLHKELAALQSRFTGLGCQL